MANDVIKGSRIKQGRGSPPSLILKAKATEVITKNQIVYISGTQGSAATVAATSKGSPLYRKVAVATNATKAKAHGDLYIALNAAPINGTLDICPVGLLSNLDTSGGAVGDTVWLSTAGAPTLTAAGYRRRIGSIATVGASGTGVVSFAPGQSPTGSLVPLVGTATITNGTAAVTVTAATLGGSFGGSPAFAQFLADDGVLVINAVAWSTNDLVISSTGNTTADRLVSYQIWI